MRDNLAKSAVFFRGEYTKRIQTRYAAIQVQIQTETKDSSLETQEKIAKNLSLVLLQSAILGGNSELYQAILKDILAAIETVEKTAQGKSQDTLKWVWGRILLSAKHAERNDIVSLADAKLAALYATQIMPPQADAASPKTETPPAAVASPKKEASPARKTGLLSAWFQRNGAELFSKEVKDKPAAMPSAKETKDTPAAATPPLKIKESATSAWSRGYYGNASKATYEANKAAMLAALEGLTIDAKASAKEQQAQLSDILWTAVMDLGGPATYGDKNMLTSIFGIMTRATSCELVETLQKIPRDDWRAWAIGLVRLATATAAATTIPAFAQNYEKSFLQLNELYAAELANAEGDNELLARLNGLLADERLADLKLAATAAAGVRHGAGPVAALAC